MTFYLMCVHIILSSVMQMAWQKNAKSEEKMQGAVDRMSKACDNFQLTISTKKTEVVHQPGSGKPYSEQTITERKKNFKLLINSPILEALSPEQCTLMMRLQP